MATKNPQAHALYRALGTLVAEIDRDLPITAALVFARVAAAGSEGVDQGQLQDELKLSSAGASRTIQTLADVHYLKDKPGLMLIERTFDPRDNRRRALRLTDKGDRLLTKVTGLLAKGNT